MEVTIMKADINPKIIEKIRESSQPENVKEFLYDILELEYDKIDEANAKLKDDYLKLINQYKG